MRYRTSKAELEKQLLEHEVQRDILQMRIDRRNAEETVVESGTKEDDEDFEFEVEMEMYRLWEERTRWDRDRWEDRMYEEMRREEESSNAHEQKT